ncbi:MAG: hypothetical protein M1819_006067 [Sarea resinae]|nr:MAG: hypothetical protein M1819_006067 [Sarea resinae]
MLLLQRPRPPSARILRAFYSTSSPQGPRNTVHRKPQPSPISRQPESPESHEHQAKKTSVEQVSDVLSSATAQENTLLSPVHISEDPNGVLNERHPAAGLLANSAVVIQRQLELMNVMLGFEQANKYVIMDPQGNHIGYMAERELGMGNMMARQWFHTHRSFTTHVFDKHEKEILRFHRPFSWISSRIRVYDPIEPASSALSPSTAMQPNTPGSLSSEISQTPAQVSPLSLSDMRIIGEAQQEWAPLRRKYNLFLFRQTQEAQSQPGSGRLSSGDIPLSNSRQLQVATPEQEAGEYRQFASINEPFLSWDFSLLSEDQRLIGSVNRNWAGFGREIFTDTGVYALRMDAAGLAEEPKHMISKTGEKSLTAYDSEKKGMTLDQRAVMLATAVSVDFDYFSRKSGSGGMGFMPMWFPMGGAAPAEAAAGEAGAAGAGAAEAGVGGAARGAGGMGEGAIAGAGTMAGYEAMNRGAQSKDASPTADQPPPSDPWGAPPQQSGQSEEVWGGDQNPWGSGGDSSGGGDVGGGDGGGDWGDWF